MFARSGDAPISNAYSRRAWLMERTADALRTFDCSTSRRASAVLSINQALREDGRRPAHVRLLDEPRETSKRALRHQAVELVDEVVKERNSRPPREADSDESVEQTETEDDVRLELLDFPPDLASESASRGGREF